MVQTHNMCVHVLIGSRPPGHPSVFLITNTISRNQILSGETKESVTVLMFCLIGLAVILCILTCVVTVGALIYSRWPRKYGRLIKT